MDVGEQDGFRNSWKVQEGALKFIHTNVVNEKRLHLEKYIGIPIRLVTMRCNVIKVIFWPLFGTHGFYISVYSIRQITSGDTVINPGPIKWKLCEIQWYDGPGSMLNQTHFPLQGDRNM